MNVLEGLSRRAMAQPRAIALVAGSREITYRRMMRDIANVAAVLQSHGVGRNDVVAIVGLGDMAHFTVTMAIAQLGAVSMALTGNPLPGTNEAVCEECGVGFVIHAVAGDFKIDLPSIRKHLKPKDLAPMAGLPVPPIADVRPDEVWRIGLSSGTTGRPKAMRYTHSSIVMRSHALNGVFPVGPGQRSMLALGTGMIFAMNYWMQALYAGGAVVSAQREPARLLEAVHAQNINMLICSPDLAMALVTVALQPGSAHASPAPNLQALSVGGASVSPRMQRLLRQHICPNLIIGYGSSEVGLMALLDPALQDENPECAGRLMPWAQAQAIGEDGSVLPPGQTGVLRVRSPFMSIGYLTQPPASAAPALEGFRDGWFYSADVGSVSPQGVLHLGGRKNDVINLSGEKIDPARIEAVIARDPAVLECAVFTVRGRLDQPRLVSLVVAEGELDEAALRLRCKEALGPFFTPKSIVRVKKLPRNANGKIMRDKLHRMVRVRHTPPQAASGAGVTP